MGFLLSLVACCLIVFLGQPTFDGSAFASYEDVIVVTANYRTNGMEPI